MARSSSVLEQYDYAGATAIAVTLLAASFFLLGAINLLQAWSARRGAVEWAMARATTEPRAVRLLLIAVALAFLALFLVVPLVMVFQQALERGLAAYLSAIREPDALSALRLTLLTAAIAVPANLLFGLAAAWAVARFDFPGRSVLLHPPTPSRRVGGGPNPSQAAPAIVERRFNGLSVSCKVTVMRNREAGTRRRGRAGRARSPGRTSPASSASR